MARKNQMANEGGGNAHPHDVQCHEYQVGAAGDPLGVQRRKLDIQIGADRQRDGRRRKYELAQRGKAGHKAAHRPKGAPGIGKRATRVRNGGGEFGKAENEGGVH